MSKQVTSKRRASATPPAAKQTKGERTRSLIKSAIVELVEERQSLDFTLDDISEKTGLTVGAFYFHFVNKDAALEEVGIDRFELFYGQILADGENAGLEEFSRIIVRQSIQSFLKNPALFRSSYTLIPKSFRVYNEWLKFRSKVVERLMALLAERRRRPGRPTPSDALDVHVLMAGLEGFMENLFFGNDGTMASISKRPMQLEMELWAHWRSVFMRPAAIDVDES